MDQRIIEEHIRRGRDFLKSPVTAQGDGSDYHTDQDLKRPQPPLVKAPMTDSPMDLPRDFESLKLSDNLYQLLLRRKSSRVYTQEDMSLLQLSFLLWASQGIKEIRRQVEGLLPGAYHYLPMTHQLELIQPMEDADALLNLVDDTLCGQTWAAKSNVVFYWSFVPYRSEWRYGIFAHRLILADMGHAAENLYLACAALGLGTCGIGAYDQSLCDKTFQLDGEEEYTIYSQSVGTVQAKDAGAEKAFYSFVEEQGL